MGGGRGGLGLLDGDFDGSGLGRVLDGQLLDLSRGSLGVLGGGLLEGLNLVCVVANVLGGGGEVLGGGGVQSRGLSG